MLIYIAELLLRMSISVIAIKLDLIPPSDEDAFLKAVHRRHTDIQVVIT